MNLFKRSNLTPFEQWEYFPRFALLYFCWTLFALLLALIILDRVALPYLEDRGQLAGECWDEDNKKIFRLMAARNHASLKNPLCCTDAFTVSPGPSRGKRIMVLGDSFVWGHGIANWNHLWWRQLDRELKKRGYGEVEVIGAGIYGANTRAELKWAPGLLRAYRPDLLIWSYVTNDPDEVNEKTKEGFVPVKTAFTLHDRMTGQMAVLHKYFPSLSYHLLSLRLEREGKRTSGTKYGFCLDDWTKELLHGENFQQYKTTVKDQAAFMRASGIPNFVVMMVFPDRQSFEPTVRPIEDLFQKNGIAYSTLR